VYALYLDPTDGKIVDFVGGLKDLAKKELRIIGNPTQRFQEDPIRVLRALRFAHKNRLKFEKSTGSALLSCAHGLQESKRERIREEILKILKDGAPEILTGEFSRLKLWPVLFPSFGSKIPGNRQVLERLKSLDSALKHRPWPSSKDVSPLLLLFHWALEPVLDESFFTDLRVSKNERLSMDSMTQWIRRMQNDPDLKLARKWVERLPRPIEAFVGAFFVLSTLAVMNQPREKATWKRYESYWSEFAKKLLESRPGVSSRPPRRRPPRSGPAIPPAARRNRTPPTGGH
jgi:tRNA nucleotidyltransferase/poly(A) polymerase